MRLALFLFLLILFCPPIFGQEPGGIKPGADTAAINRLFHRATKLPDPDSEIILFNEVLKLSIAANYADGAFNAIMTTGIKYHEKGNIAQSRKYYLEALPWARKTTRIIDAVAWCYNNIGSSYSDEGDYTKASEYYYIALQELKKIENIPTTTAANNYMAIGGIKTLLNQPDTALAYYNKAEDVARKGKFYFQLAQALGCKGDYYAKINKPDSAQKFFNEIADIGKLTGKIDLQALANAQLGGLFVQQKQYKKAVSYLKTAISLATGRYNYLVINSDYDLGDALYHLGKYKEAATLIEHVLNELKAQNNKNGYIDCYAKLADIYGASGQYKKALECKDSVIVYKDELTGTEKAKALKQMEIKYKTAEKDKEIAQNQLLIAQQKNKIASKNTWIAGIAGGICLLFIISISLYSRARHKQWLQAEQIKTLEHENTISILKGVVQGEENERSRLARELHDGIGGMLSAAMMRLMAVRHQDEGVTAIPAYNEALGLLGEMGDEIRKTAHNLMPEVLLKQALPEAVRAYCNSLQEGSPLQIDFQSYGSFEAIPEDFKLNVYRIIQELLKNITQHAQATTAFVQLMMHENTLTITVEDNGVGFDTGATKEGLGLRNLQTRVSSLDGHCTIESETGRGTSVYIEVPINP